jgi:hypothetical protein
MGGVEVTNVIDEREAKRLVSGELLGAPTAPAATRRNH